MTPRTILYTGKGGVGKTSVAAATARAVADSGRRTVVLSTDPAHSLSDSLETEIGGEPTPIAPNLWAQEVRAEREMERNWHAVQEWLGSLLAERGIDRIVAEEMTVPPGLDELFSLLQIKSHRDSGEFETIIVDCAPTGETLRLLSFPDVARWWLEKVFPWEKRIMSAARPLAKTFLDLRLPTSDVYADVQRLVLNLIAMNEILRDRERASVRLVMNPEKMVVREAQRTFTYLNLYGYVTDAVVVNRVFPQEVRNGYFAAWRAVQQEQIDLVEQAFAPVPVLRAPFFEQEVVGGEMLDRLAQAVFSGVDPEAMLYHDVSQELMMEDGVAELRLKVPFTEKGEIELKKVGLELVVRVAGHKRNIMLPPALAPYRPRGAKLDGGALTVTFERPNGPESEGGTHGGATLAAQDRL
jgi:arsenite-transporting ATPase